MLKDIMLALPVIRVVHEGVLDAAQIAAQSWEPIYTRTISHLYSWPQRASCPPEEEDCPNGKVEREPRKVVEPKCSAARGGIAK